VVEFTKSEAKEWARQHYRGLDGVVSPSFTPDLSELDEEGIRHDVRENINKGMFSFLCQTEVCSMTFEERKRFLEIACDEARGKILVSMFTGIDTFEQDIELLKHFEKVGGTHTLLGWPGTFYARSEEDIYNVTKMVCDATNVAVDLWPKPKFDFARFHPSHFNPQLVERLTEIPNVVSAKAYLSDGFGKWAEVHHRVGDKVLLQSAEVEEWPVSIAMYKQQWAGPGDYTIFDETGDNPRIVKLFDLFRRGDFLQAMELYWELAPITMGARRAMFQSGWLGVKYMQWLTGGNGGLYRQPAGVPTQGHKDAMRAGVRAAGVTPREPEEEFYVGRVNYAKGIRPRYFLHAGV
jgi:4-hydroxy-tetrahydrodipicolinate synthase